MEGQGTEINIYRVLNKIQELKELNKKEKIL